MDVVRYADTAGDNADYPVPEARLYRDYIIDSFNADKPYDEFVREQIAGDLLAKRGPAEKYAEQVIATGFLALSRRYATAPYELWHLTLEDTIDTVGRAYLGMTLRCARCHDHKFDPVPTRDYYALYGIFASTQFPVRRLGRIRVDEVRPPGVRAARAGSRRRVRPWSAYQREIDAAAERNRPSSRRREPRDKGRRQPTQALQTRLARSSSGAEHPKRCRWPTRSAKGRSPMPTSNCTVNRASPGAIVPRGAAAFPCRTSTAPPPEPTRAAGSSWPIGSRRRAIRSRRA